MSEAVDLNRISGEQRLAFYGLLFSLARADGSFDEEEMITIHALLDDSGFSPEQRDELRAFCVHPPDPRTCLATLAEAPDEFRFGVLAALVDLALADDCCTAEEKAALDAARTALCISEGQARCIETLVRSLKPMLENPTPERQGALEAAAQAMISVGIPASTAFFLGSVQDLEKAGRQDVMRAMGLGWGRKSSLASSLFSGLTAAPSLTGFWDGDEEEGRWSAARRKRAEQAIARLESIAKDLEATLGENAPPEETRRLEAIRQLILTRRSVLGDLA